MKKACIIYWFTVVLILAFYSSACPQSRRGFDLRGSEMPERLKNFDIKDYFIESEFKKAGVIHALNGRVVVVHKATREAFFGMEGDFVYENDSLETLDDSRCRVKLVNEDVMSMAPNTRIDLDKVTFKREKKSFFSMLKGKAMFYAMRLFSFKKSRMKVRTPTTVIGVRGTKFGTHVYWENKEGKAGGVKLAYAGDRIDLAELGPIGAGKSYTDCFSEDGYLDVNGKTIAPGQMYQGEIKAVKPTPPQYVEGFESDTKVKKPEPAAEEEMSKKEKEEKKPAKKEEKEKEGEKEKDSEREEKKKPPEGEEEKKPVRRPPPPPESKPPEAQPPPPPPEIKKDPVEEVDEPKIEDGMRANGISTIITDRNGKAYFQLNPTKTPIYVTEDPDEKHWPAGIRVAGELFHNERGAVMEDYMMVTKEAEPPQENGNGDYRQQGNSQRKMTVEYFDWGYGQDISREPAHDFNYFEGGSYRDEKGHEFLKWGWWEDISEKDKGFIGEHDGKEFFAADATIWDIKGILTHPDYITYLHEKDFKAAYNGQARGILTDTVKDKPHYEWGSFSCEIDFGSRMVKRFEIATQGVHIQNGAGKLFGDGSFDITEYSGTIMKLPINQDPGEVAMGGCGGRKAEGVGGIWYTTDSKGRYWATGEFHGKR